MSKLHFYFLATFALCSVAMPNPAPIPVPVPQNFGKCTALALGFAIDNMQRCVNKAIMDAEQGHKRGESNRFDKEKPSLFTKMSLILQ